MPAAWVSPIPPPNLAPQEPRNHTSSCPRPLGYPRVRSWPLPIPAIKQQSLLRPLWPCKCKMLASALEADRLSCAVLRGSPSSCASESHQPNTHRQSPLQCTSSAGKCAANQDPCSCSWAPIRPCFLLLASITMPTWAKPLLLCTCIPPVQYPSAASIAECILKGRVGSHRTACWQPGDPHHQVALALAACLAPITSRVPPASPHHYTAPAPECVHTTSSGHRFCLPWFLATCPGRAAEGPISAWNTAHFPHYLLKTTQLSVLWTPTAWAEEISHPHTQGATLQHQAWGQSHAPTCLPPSAERLPLLKSVQRVWKR